MLLINEIEKEYPEKLRPFKRFILREYLQYKILNIIYSSKYGKDLSFIGGTALRILYQNQRFSEDLDFDNLGLNRESLTELTHIICSSLKNEGFESTIKNTMKNAFRCRIKIPKLLYDNKLSPIKEEIILIQFDTEPQSFPHNTELKLINRFDVLQNIVTSPLDVLFSQKLYAAFNRKRPKGRDFFDIIFLSNKTKPNFEYLKLKLNIDNINKLKDYLIEKCSKVDFSDLANDVRPFLFNSADINKVKLFPDWVKSIT
ncbi:MAG: nucleotidyl transferase AbiEii/AbiGii toxin family protein [Legionellales bacterium]|nr:nucleotidyl transferase AbiEii/AbiGii toxin family protein [Legionellales bacterium]